MRARVGLARVCSPPPLSPPLLSAPQPMFVLFRRPALFHGQASVLGDNAAWGVELGDARGRSCAVRRGWGRGFDRWPWLPVPAPAPAGPEPRRCWRRGRPETEARRRRVYSASSAGRLQRGVGFRSAKQSETRL